MGKTTTAVNLSAALARAGHPTLLVDLDPQGNATSGLGIADEHRTPSIYEVLRGEIAADQAVRPTALPSLFVLPATADLAGASVELMQQEQREFFLRHALAPLASRFSYILIDAPPSLGLLTMNALVGAERVLIPVQSEYYALEGLGQLLQTIELVKAHLHPTLDLLGAVVTMFDRRVKVAHEVVREVREHFPGHVFSAVIPRSVRLSEAPSYGKTIFDYDQASAGAQAYTTLAQEVHARVLELSRQSVQVP